MSVRQVVLLLMGTVDVRRGIAGTLTCRSWIDLTWVYFLGFIDYYHWKAASKPMVLWGQTPQVINVEQIDLHWLTRSTVEC
jgi:hypothetical protein